MTSLKLHIEKAGLHSTIQDQGRIGQQIYGVPVGGALDKEAMSLANQLVGNKVHNPVIECTLLGPRIRIEGSGSFAFTGAPMKVELNGKLIDGYKAHKLAKNDILDIGHCQEGCRTYLAFSGEWQCTEWLGSKSALNSFIDIGGQFGKLKVGDWIEILNTDNEFEYNVKITNPHFSNVYTIRVITGPEFEIFKIEEIQSFFEQVFTVSNDADRMGYRLEEKIEGYSPIRDEISSGIIPGSIQVTNSGQPIVLLADAQTTGGYPRIAHVISEDLNVFGQIRPGNKVKFQLLSL